MFLGYTLAAISIARTPRASNIFAVLGVPILLFLLPILDTLLVTFTRILRGQSPVQGGRDHTSHRLVAFGLTERQAVLVLYGIAIVAGIAGTAFESLDYSLSLVLIPILLVAMALLAAYLGRLRVVPSHAAPPQGAITRLVIELTFKRRILEVILDFLLISIAYYLAFWTASGFFLDSETLDQVFLFLPVALGVTFASYFLFGIYRGLWRYVGLDELLRFARAALGGLIGFAALMIFIFPAAGVPNAVYLLFGVFLLISLVASRLSFRVLDRVFSRQTARTQERNVLICGAGDAGEMVLRWIQMNPKLGYRPIGFLDDDPFKKGRRIHGVDVLGAVEDLEALLDERNIDGIIVTPAADETTPLSLHLAMQASRDRGVWVRRLRFEFELVE